MPNYVLFQLKRRFYCTLCITPCESFLWKKNVLLERLLRQLSWELKADCVWDFSKLIEKKHESSFKLFSPFMMGKNKPNKRLKSCLIIFLSYNIFKKSSINFIIHTFLHNLPCPHRAPGWSIRESNNPKDYLGVLLEDKMIAKMRISQYVTIGSLNELYFQA